MAYDANKHQVFSQRCRNFIRELDNLYTEAGKIEDIYTNETGSGTDPAWVDTGIATAVEHVDAILVMQRLRDMLAMDEQNQVIAVEDQTARLTPFLQ